MVIKDFSHWEPWGRLWDKWVRDFKGEQNIQLDHILFVDLYNYFRRQVKALEIDPYTVDVESIISPNLTYEENKTLLAEVLRVPPSEEEYDAMYEGYKAALKSQVEEKYPEVVADWEKRVEELERETEKLPRVEREKQRFKKLAEELSYKLEETERRYKQELEALAQKVKPLKVRILRDFEHGIERYREGDVIESRDVDWVLSLIDQGLAERVAPEVAVEKVAPPKPLEAPPEEVFKPPEKVPVEVPKPKMLPPVPEKCPIDDTPLKQMEKVPLFIEDPLRLEPEEEYWRARMGLPLPTVSVEWIDVPPTMKVWVCEREHYFERYADGRLVERSPEFLYRKIIRETAKLRRLEPPPTVRPPWEAWKRERVRVERVWVGPHVPRLEEWLEDVKGLSMEEFDSKPIEEIERLVGEYQEFITRRL